MNIKKYEAYRPGPEEVRAKVDQFLLSEKIKEIRRRGEEIRLRFAWLDIKEKGYEPEERYNHNHDSKGRFASASGGGKNLTGGNKSDIMNSKEPLSIFLNSSDQLYINAKKIKPIEGYQDIVIHGSKDGFCYKDKDGKEIPVNSAEFSDILKNSGLLTGDKIRLISCETAAEGAHAAQWLADDLGIEVLAPSDVVWVNFDGSMTIGKTPDANDGRWVTVKPRKNGD